jgi:hypothetical protein
MLHYFTRTAMAGAVLVLFTGVAEAKPACRDAAGKFTACPAAATAQAGRCRSATGQFTKCPAPAATVARTGTAANTAAIVPAPGTATARCRDGSMSASRHRSGTCASHGGVAAWLQQR